MIPSYHPSRSRNLEPLVRNALRCSFVDRVVVSNHNPSVRLHRWKWTTLPRVSVIEHPIRRGCGHGWMVAHEWPSPYYLVLDDDTLPEPRQLGRLFAKLLADPTVPHGLAGWRADGHFVERQECDVECLFNVYAVTRQQVERYVSLTETLTNRYDIAPSVIEFYADDIVISHTGERAARSHDLGWVLRCRTSDGEGVAISRDPEFWPHRLRVMRALAEIKRAEDSTGEVAYG